MPAVPVTVYDLDTGEPIVTHYTDMEGVAEFCGLDGGRYRIRVATIEPYRTYMDVQPAYIDVDLSAGAPELVEFGARLKRCALIRDLWTGQIDARGRCNLYWAREIMRELAGEAHEEDVVTLLGLVELAWLPEPFQFTDDPNGQGPVGEEGLREALAILLCQPCFKWCPCDCHHHCGDCGKHNGGGLGGDEASNSSGGNAAVLRQHDHHEHHGDDDDNDGADGPDGWDGCCVWCPHCPPSLHCHCRKWARCELLADELNQKAGYVSSLGEFQSLVAWESEYLLSTWQKPGWVDYLYQNTVIMWLLNGCHTDL